MSTHNRPGNSITTNRRAFLGGSILGGLALAGVASGQEAGALRTSPSRPVGQNSEGRGGAASEMPTGQLGKLKVSRLISGGNLLSGWCHQRDLLFVRQLAEAYLTEKKQFDTLQWMEEVGVNTIMIDMMQMPIVNRYKKERGGKIQTIVSVREDWGEWRRPNAQNLKAQIAKAVDQGPDLLFLHGGYCDRLVQAGLQAGQSDRIEFLGEALQFIRDKGFIAGLGSHALEVPIECDKRGIEPDYYVKTFHHDRYWSATPKGQRKRFCVDGPRSLDHNEFCDNIFCIDPEETAAFMLKKKQPWVAFKVLAAGAIDAKSGFTYAFENGADFLAVGMFDFNIAEDVRVVREVVKEMKRGRPWVG
ncbi:MAG: hypothetical protein ACM359_10500 [Bacillota bacterium]